MGIIRTITRDLICDGCGKRERESFMINDESIEEDWDWFRSKNFIFEDRGIGLLCKREGAQKAKRSCAIKAFEDQGRPYTECNLEGCDDVKIGTSEHDAPMYKCRRCGREWTGLNIKAADAALKTLFAPEVQTWKVLN